MQFTKFWKWQSIFLLTVAVGAACLWKSAPKNDETAPRPVATVRGSVIVKRKNLRTTTTLQSNDKLYEGDVVVTKLASASVRFNDGSEVDMKNNTGLEITKPISVGKGKTLFRALNGRMTAHLRPGRVISTRTALVRVKGTIIYLDIEDDGTTTLCVLEGAAEFFNPCGQVLVPAGAQSTVEPGNAPQPPQVIPDIKSLWDDWRKGSGANGPVDPPVTNPVLTTQSNAQMKPRKDDDACGVGKAEAPKY